MPNERKATTYNQIVGVLKTGDVFVLEDIFEYTAGFKGATRYMMEPLTKQDIEDQNSPEYVRDYWEDAVSHRMTDLGLEEWTKEQVENIPDGLYSLSDDPSFREETAQAYDELTEDQKAELDEAVGKDKNFVDWVCISCGRCGKISEDGFAVIFRPDLLKAIQEAES